jgi:hypothetical protein
LALRNPLNGKINAPGLYAKLLKETPNLSGHLVIFNKTKKDARSETEVLLKLFTEDYKVPRSRLRFFFAKNKGTPDVEFWIVP